MAFLTRVPYESAARTLTQTKRSYAGYTIRQGLAITMVILFHVYVHATVLSWLVGLFLAENKTGSTVMAVLTELYQNTEVIDTKGCCRSTTL
jgi:hypothetical protein